MKLPLNRKDRRAQLKRSSVKASARPSPATQQRTQGTYDPARMGGLTTAFNKDIRVAFAMFKASVQEQVRQMFAAAQARDYLSPLSLNYDGHWVTLESEQHVFIGGDGKMYFHGPPEGRNGKGATGEKGIASKQYGRDQNGRGSAGGGADSERSGGRGGAGTTVHEPDASGGAMAETAQGSASAGAGEGGHDAGKSTSGVAARRVPADLKHVNAKLDRFEKLFRSKDQHMVADWMKQLRDHINATGTDASLKAIGEGKGAGPNAKGEVQYWGVGTDEANWKHMGDFIQSYLGRNGISVVTGDTSSPDAPLISALGKPDRYVAEHGDFKPAEMHFKDKLTESKSLPGLEKSEDLDKLMGREAGATRHLTPEVTDKLDAEYGKGGWIVKCYDDNAAAGYGIFFPQRVQAIGQQARDTIWQAGSKLAQYGFSLDRDKDGKVSGLKHEGGDTYAFGSKKYEETINGDARHWGDQAAMAAEHEKGPMLPEGSFMAQPAFKAVGISDADRAAGKTWHEKNEGRVHLQTKPDGSVEVIPHSTWLKGGSLPVVFEDDDTRSMAAAAKAAIEKIPHEARKGQVYAPDVMKNADGGYSVVELNAQGDFNGSGYLHDNGFTIDAYTSHLTGREPLHVSFIRKLLTARAKGDTATVNALLELLWNQYTINAAEYDEHKHTRAKDGRFGSQAGDSKGTAPAAGTPARSVNGVDAPAIPPGEPPAKTEKELLERGDKKAEATMGKFRTALKALGNNAAAAWVKSALGWVKDKTVQFYNMLEKRYGKKQAIAVFASGQVFSWSATGIGAMMGIPLVVPGMSVVASIPAMALAETYYQIRGKHVKSAAADTEEKPPVGNAKKVEVPDEEDVQDDGDEASDGSVDIAAARKIAAALGRAVVKILGQHAEMNPFPAAANEERDPSEFDDGKPVPPHDGVTLPTMNEDYEFETSAGKLSRFRGWLRSRMGTTLVGDAVIQDYIDKAYRKGAARSFTELRKGQRVAGQAPISKVPTGALPPDHEGEIYVRGMVQRGATVQKVKLLAARTFSEMEDVNARMGTRMTRILADGLVSGDTPKQIAKRMSDEVGLGMERAMLITRTELVRAHAEGQLDALSDLGHKTVTAMVEMVGSADGRMCPECAELKGEVMSLADARGVLPVHPNCRCAWVPVLKKPTNNFYGLANRSQHGNDTNGTTSSSQLVSDALKVVSGHAADPELAARLGFTDGSMTINNDDEDDDGPLLTGGKWVTTDEGHRLYIRDGKAVGGNPHIVRAFNNGGSKKGSGSSDKGTSKKVADKPREEPKVKPTSAKEDKGGGDASKHVATLADKLEKTDTISTPDLHDSVPAALRPHLSKALFHLWDEGAIQMSRDFDASHFGKADLAKMPQEGGHAFTTVAVTDPGKVRAALAKFTINMAGHQGSETGDNCGIGAGGFQPGNTCAKGDGTATDIKSKFIGEKVGKAEQRYADAIEEEVARGIGGRVISRIGNVYQPSDVGIGSNHSIEVKSLLKGQKNAITVHEDALLRKVDYLASKPHGHQYHTVVIDDRHQYEGGAHKDKHSGHRIYYRRGSGRYSLSTMHQVRNMAELKRLIRADEAQLPEKAKGALPSDPRVIAQLRHAAANAHAARLKKDRALKARKRETATTNAFCPTGEGGGIDPTCSPLF